jgi:hypothetical protein
MLQPMSEEPPLSIKCKDKFLIQSTVITAEKEAIPLNDLVCLLSSLPRAVRLLIHPLSHSGI